MKKWNFKSKLLISLIPTVMLLVISGEAQATMIPDLGAAGNFAVLGLAGTETITNSLVTINGNEGAVQGGSIANNAPSTVNGNVYVDQNSQYSGPGSLKGSLIAQPSMGSSGAVQSAVNDLIAQINGYTFGSSLGNINTATILNASGTLTLDSIGAINLNNANLTLNGASNQYFVIKSSGDLSLVGTAALQLTGGITPDHVIYYFTGSSGSFNTKVGDTMDGIFLAPDYTMSLDGIFNGELISGENISLLSGAVVNQVSSTSSISATPEPSTWLLFGTGILLMGVMAARKQKGLMNKA